MKSKSMILRIALLIETVLLLLFFFCKGRVVLVFAPGYKAKNSLYFITHNVLPYVWISFIVATILGIVGCIIAEKVKGIINIVVAILYISAAICIRNEVPLEVRIVFWYLFIAVAILYFITSILLLTMLVKGGKTGMQTNYNTNYNNSNNYNPSAPKTGYISMVMHVLLLIFTFIIWYWIWVYKTTEYTSQNGDNRSPVNQLLLVMFVPFYFIYWTYKTAQFVDPESATMCLLLAIFVGIVPPIILQDKINKQCMYSSYQAGSNMNQGYQQPYQAGPNMNQGYQQPYQAGPNMNQGYQQPYQAGPNMNQPYQQQYQTGPNMNQGNVSTSSANNFATVSAQLKEFEELYKQGYITEEEYRQKRKDIIGI